jgi:hypothetical protein
MNHDNSDRLRKLKNIRKEVIGRLVPMNVAFHPPQNNKRLLIKNNPIGYNLLIKYLTVEMEIQILQGNIDRSKEVEVHKIELETEFQRIQQEDKKEI